MVLTDGVRFVALLFQSFRTPLTAFNALFLPLPSRVLQVSIFPEVVLLLESSLQNSADHSTCFLSFYGGVWGYKYFLVLLKMRFIFLVFLFWPQCVACGNLVPPSKTDTGASAVKAQSPRHWTARGFSVGDFQKKGLERSMISYLNPENCGGDFQEVALIMTIQIFLRNKNKTEKPKRNSFRKAALSSGNLCSVVVPSSDMPIYTGA